MGIAKREPTIGELLADPMMGAVLQHSRTTADDLLTMMIEARDRLARSRVSEALASDHAPEDSRPI